jgi:hypothetical protein
VDSNLTGANVFYCVSLNAQYAITCDGLYRMNGNTAYKIVANVRVSSVMSGATPKALINGRLVRAGDTVDAGLGIIFDGVKGNQLVFKDRSGATVQRRY